MAFHVACPITCRRICYCELGFPSKLRNEKGKNGFLEEVFRIEEFVKDPWLLKADVNATVQVKVPKVAIVVPPPLLTPTPLIPVSASGGGSVGGDGVVAGVGDVDEAALAISAQTKRAALQKKAAAASLVAEDYARRFESGEVAVVGTLKDDGGEDQSLSNAKVMCRLCFGGENEGSERARKMLPCSSCGKKYHRGCLKSWAQNRDLFHWSSWTCPSCRICEVCRRIGEPSKFMFCKRCDGAYHCYCQHPPHKNVGSGPYLCPKHTKCHSCGSSVPGNGLSVRWFLGYTCCDACGRLFVRGNYCPVCLKVYRDSEATPMVCCDVCQRWVHCQCDGISDAKYLQFQVDGNLQYVCPTCRGECCQVRNLEEAVQELWRRRDEADKDLISNLRASVGLPSQEEIFSISPFSDDEENGPAVLKNEYGRSLKFSLKGLVEKSPKKIKEYGKKSSNKKYGKKKGNLISPSGGAEAQPSFEGHEGHDDASSLGYASTDNRNEQTQPSRSGGEPDSLVSHVAGGLFDGTSSINAGALKHKFIDEVTVSNGNRAPRTVKIKNSKLKGSSNTGDDTGNQNNTTKSSRKFVIHLGNRNKKMASSPRSDASSYQKEQDLTTSNGSEDMGGSGLNDSLEKQDTAAKLNYGKAVILDEMKGPKLRNKEGNLIKIRTEATTELLPKFSGERFPDTVESVSAVTTRSSLGKRSVEDTAALRMNSDLVSRGSKLSAAMNDDINHTPSASHSQKEPKLLKFKFKNPITDNHISWTPKEEERSSVKGQRSKRKRPSPLQEKASNKGDAGDDPLPSYDDNSMDEIMDANWILQKLGKDAIGKRVEVHQPSDNSWNKGTVREVFEGSIVFVALDNGKSRNLELGKQGIRFISQKQRR